MDQISRDGLDVIRQMSAIVVGHARGLEALQRKDLLRLYHATGDTAGIEAESRTDSASMRQREALRDAALSINTIANQVVVGIVTVDAPGPSAQTRNNGITCGQPHPRCSCTHRSNDHNNTVMQAFRDTTRVRTMNANNTAPEVADMKRLEQPIFSRYPGLLLAATLGCTPSAWPLNLPRMAMPPSPGARPMPSSGNPGKWVTSCSGIPSS